MRLYCTRTYTQRVGVIRGFTVLLIPMLDLRLHGADSFDVLIKLRPGVSRFSVLFLCIETEHVYALEGMRRSSNRSLCSLLAQ